MREVLLARIQPALEQLGEQLVDMLLERVELHVNQLELAFDAATSAFASDLSVTDGAARRYDVRTQGQAAGSGAQRRSQVECRAEQIRERDKAAARSSESDAASTAGDATSHGRRRGACSPTVNPALQQGQDLPPSTSSRTATNLGGEVADAAAKQTPPSTDAAPVSEVATSSTHRRSSDPPAKTRICGCAPRGRHRKDCSLPNISTSPASAPDPALTTARSPATSPISSSTRSDRFAKIEASKAQRELARRERGERARSFIRRDGVKPTTLEKARAVDDGGAAERDLDSIEPIASFEF